MLVLERQFRCLSEKGHGAGGGEVLGTSNLLLAIKFSSGKKLPPAYSPTPAHNHTHTPQHDFSAELKTLHRIALCALSIDRKPYPSLPNISIPDATVPQPFPPLDDFITDLPTIRRVLEKQQKQLSGLIMQHVISTAVLEFGQEDGNDKKANSTAYVTSILFGQGNLTGQVLSFYGRYEDEWVFRSGIEGRKLARKSLVPFVSFIIPPFSIEHLVNRRMNRVLAILETWR